MLSPDRLLLPNVSAQLHDIDSGGGFLVRALNAGPGDFYGRLVVPLASGRAVEAQPHAPAGRIAAAGDVAGAGGRRRERPGLRAAASSRDGRERH
jgi:hypothetical protein